MNKIFKTIWNAARHLVVVVNETTHAHGKESATVRSESVGSFTNPRSFDIPFAKCAVAIALATAYACPQAAPDGFFESSVTISEDLTLSGVNSPGGYFNVENGVTVTMNGRWHIHNNDRGDGDQRFDQINNRGTMISDSVIYFSPQRGASDGITNYNRFIVNEEFTNTSSSIAYYENTSNGVTTFNNAQVTFTTGSFSNDGQLNFNGTTVAEINRILGTGDVYIGGELTVNGDSDIGELELSTGKFTVTAGNVSVLDSLTGSGDIVIGSGASMSLESGMLFRVNDPEEVALNTISLNATQEESPVQRFTELFTAYAGVDVLNSVKSLSFDGGTLYITANITQTQRDDMVQAFKEAF